MSLEKINILNKILNFFGAKAFRQVNNAEIIKIISLFKPFNVGIPLIRIGDNKDGGYLLPDILHNIKYCFSLGVGTVSSFEKELEKYSIKSFLVDKTVDAPGAELKDYSFDKKLIHSFNQGDKVNVNDWLLSKLDKSDFDKSIIQIDTDGFEYEILIALDEKLLSKFNIIVVEFHGLELIGNEYFNFILNSVVSKLNLYHTPVHIHPNNCCGIHKVGSFLTPSVLEATFLNNKLFDEKKPIDHLPNKLDYKNVQKKEEIFLESYWYK